MKYRRYVQPGGTYFFTIVTYNRNNIFNSPGACNLLMQSIKSVQKKHPFKTIAYCICPDHIHMIWKLPKDDSGYSTRLRLIKSKFSRQWDGDFSTVKSQSREKKNERMVWQRRYWEHLIKDDNDLAKHIEYIFYNPVNHGYVNAPILWKYSNFKEYVSAGLYSEDWGMNIDSTYFDNIRGE